MTRIFQLASVGVLIASMWVSAEAQDRVGSFGQSLLFPLDLEPVSNGGSVIYGLDFGYSYNERWWGTLSTEFGLRENERIDLSFGIRYYPLLYPSLKPFAYASFLYFIDPKNDIGWRAGLGLDYDLGRLTGVNNLHLEFHTGMSSAIINNADDIYSVDLARIGFAFNY